MVDRRRTGNIIFDETQQRIADFRKVFGIFLFYRSHVV